MTLPTDGVQYDILERAVEAVKDVPGLFLEIGTRRGGSLQIIIDAAIRTGQYRHVVSVDPYGNILYNDGKEVTRYDYTNNMKKSAMRAIWEYVHDLPVNFIPICLTDREFMTRFRDGVPVYDEEPVTIGNYAFLFLDGPHDTGGVLEEVAFFAPRMPPGGNMVIDNYDFFNVDRILEAAAAWNLKEVERNEQKIRLCRMASGEALKIYVDGKPVGLSHPVEMNAPDFDFKLPEPKTGTIDKTGLI